MCLPQRAGRATFDFLRSKCYNEKQKLQIFHIAGPKIKTDRRVVMHTYTTNQIEWLSIIGLFVILASSSLGWVTGECWANPRPKEGTNTNCWKNEKLVAFFLTAIALFISGVIGWHWTQVFPIGFFFFLFLGYRKEKFRGKTAEKQAEQIPDDPNPPQPERIDIFG
jgi:hypothetical protein